MVIVAGREDDMFGVIDKDTKQRIIAVRLHGTCGQWEQRTSRRDTRCVNTLEMRLDYSTDFLTVLFIITYCTGN